MSKIMKKMLLALCIFAGILFVCNISQASGGLRLRSLDYDVTLNADGTADVVETWRISIEDTNTLFKTFKIDTSKYKEITDVKVAEIKSNGSKTNFSRINQYKYHVDKNCYYALVYKGKFEIAWGAHAEDTTRTYEISYRIIDAVKNYNDCSEFYWQFVNTESEIPADVVTGNIRLPMSVTNIDDLKVWAHGPLNGNIERVSSNQVMFRVEDFRENTMLEARVVTPTNIFYLNQNTVNTNKKESILVEEQAWADEANALREKIAKQQEMAKNIIIAVFIIGNLIGIVVAIIVIIKIIKYHKELKTKPILKPEEKMQYYRDIPNEKATPAEAGFLYYFKSTGLGVNIGKIFSATMLDLCIKKYIQFEEVPDKKNQIRVIINEKDIAELPEDEKIVYELLKKVAKNETNSFTMKEFEKYAGNHSSTITSKFQDIEQKAKSSQENQGNYSKKWIKESEKWLTKELGYMFLFIISIICMQTLTIPSLIAVIYSSIISRRCKQLTQSGVNEKEKWEALKRYMEDFSMMKEKEVPELILWEKYLVYATAFGIAEKVLKQLKVVYPQLTDTDYLNSHGYTYMYLMYSNSFNTSFMNTLNRSVNNSYTSATNYSSGGGYGGGFSSGGGFGGGGGRNGRKIGYK